MNPLRVPILLSFVLQAIPSIGAESGPPTAGRAAAEMPGRGRAPPLTAAERVSAVAEVAPDGRMARRGVVKRSKRSDLSSLLQVSVDPDGEILSALSAMDEEPPEPM
mmetsp:Transcript_69323/g.184285  ORF Transcript_69323/g.184285 Transcript_69323/m.184285 type:complete len:107 (-) Transcript_69323:143-463(-)